MTQRKKFVYFFSICFVALLFTLPLCFTKTISNSSYVARSPIAPTFYGIMAIFSLIVLILYCALFRKKYFWLLLTIISVCICNVGYFALSLSSNLTEAILANKIAYFGNVFLPMFLLVTIADACRFRYNKFIVYILFAISCIMFLFCATSGYFDLFYKSVNFEILNGVVHLHKIYGLMHTFYMLYVFAYFSLMIVIIIYSHKRGKLVSKKHVIFLLLLVFVNILLWLLERFIHIPIEILSFSYVLTTILTIYVYKQLNSFGLLDYYNISLDLPSDEVKNTILSDEADELNEEFVCDNLASFSDDKLKELFRNLKLEAPLSNKEIEIAVLMIKNIKRKKIAEFMYVTEHTIKFHVSNIFKKTNVSNRNELAELLKKNI